jgi:hypothetical protein
MLLTKSNELSTMPIETLHILPTHDKTDDGFKYDDKYVGKLFKYQNSLYYFKERSYIEYPIELLNTIEKAVQESVNSKIKDTIAMIESVANKATDFVSKQDLQEIKYNLELFENRIDFEKIKNLFEITINNKLENINVDLNEVKDKVKRLQSTIDIEKICSIIDQSVDSKINEDQINSMIDNKLKAVYDNFDKVVKNLVKENLKDSHRDQTGKLKMTTLITLKELGYSPSEISEMVKNGLV